MNKNIKRIIDFLILVATLLVGIYMVLKMGDFALITYDVIKQNDMNQYTLVERIQLYTDGKLAYYRTVVSK